MRRVIRLSEEDWRALAQAIYMGSPTLRAAYGKRSIRFAHDDLDIVVDFEHDRELAHDCAMRAGEPHVCAHCLPKPSDRCTGCGNPINVGTHGGFGRGGCV